MEHREVGRSGIAVPRVILGAGNFGGVGSDLSVVGSGESKEDAFAVMDAAWERGIDCFDTASSYGGGASERFIGRWREARRPGGLILTSKLFHPRFHGDDGGLTRERVRRVVDDSLTVLGVDRVDFYLTHEPDPSTPLEETLGAFDELRAEGVIRAAGVSNVDGDYVRECLRIADEHGYARIEYVQNEYSLLARESGRDVLPLCIEHGLGFAAFSPLAGGWLTGKYSEGRPYPGGSRMTLRPGPYEQFANPEVFRAIDALRGRAGELGVSSAALAIAWVLAEPGVTAVVVGPRNPEQLDASLSALEIELSEDERSELERLFP
jgi:aryl-alcohol dehydrogenase-like predicted oxidoreductase